MKPKITGALLASVIALNVWASLGICASESLPPLIDAQVPKNLDELWGDYDPRSEPLNTKLVAQWEEDGVVVEYVVFDIGTFKGQKSVVSGFYAYPKGKKDLPALLEIHGGGGRAQIDAALWGARNGYATFSINWGGKNPPLPSFKEGDPNTDWGAIDATQDGHNSHYNHMTPDDKTLDPVESPRNNNWFLLTLSCRRGLTFLEQQPQVDADRIGVYGHSMGGKLSMDVASIDKRVKVAAPSCGGTGAAPDVLSGMPGSGMGRKSSKLMRDTIDDIPYLKRLTCPTIFISPSNDFAGPMDNMYLNEKLVQTPFFYYSISPHYNHQHKSEFIVNTLLIFEQFLKNNFTYPESPKLAINLDTTDRIPSVELTADSSMPIETVDIYYSLDPHVLTRFWRDAEAKKVGNKWVARCPVMNTEHPLFVFSNVTYKADIAHFVEPAHTAKFDNRFALSSNMIRVMPEELKQYGVKATDKPSRLVEDFSRGWHDWYRKYWDSSHHWRASTRKLKDPKYRPPQGAKLLIDIKTDKDNTLVFHFNCNTWGAYAGEPAASFVAYKEIKGSPNWQTVEVSEADLCYKSLPRGKSARDPLPEPSWKYITEFDLCSRTRGGFYKNGEKLDVSRPWQGSKEFRKLRWEGGTYPDNFVVSGGVMELSQKELDLKISSAIKASWEGTNNYVEDQKPDALGRVYLTPAMATKTQTFLNLVGKDANIDGNKKISIGGKAYAHGLGVHAKSELVFPLDGNYATFHVVPGPADSHNGELEMKVLVDGKQVFSSGPVRGLTYEPTPLNIPVSGAKLLTLVVTDGGNGNRGDHAHWAEAYLTVKK